MDDWLTLSIKLRAPIIAENSREYSPHLIPLLISVSDLINAKSSALAHRRGIQRGIGNGMAYRIPPLVPTLTRTVQILAAVHLFSTHVAEIRLCTGFSMLPTLSHEGDFVLVSPIPYWAPFFKHRPKRGDLVIASSPMDPRLAVCKRVIGLPGDLIEVECRRGVTIREKWVGEEDTMYDEGEKSSGSKVERWTDSEGRRMAKKRKGENQWVKVPKGHVWLQGDNMSNSTDSRMYGPVPLAMVKGKVLARVWPSWSWLSNPVKPL